MEVRPSGRLFSLKGGRREKKGGREGKAWSKRHVVPLPSSQKKKGKRGEKEKGDPPAGDRTRVLYTTF